MTIVRNPDDSPNKARDIKTGQVVTCPACAFPLVIDSINTILEYIFELMHAFKRRPIFRIADGYATIHVFQNCGDHVKLFCLIIGKTTITGSKPLGKLCSACPQPLAPRKVFVCRWVKIIREWLSTVGYRERIVAVPVDVPNDSTQLIFGQSPTKSQRRNELKGIDSMAGTRIPSKRG